jgi:hypothetical protein
MNADKENKGFIRVHLCYLWLELGGFTAPAACYGFSSKQHLASEISGCEYDFNGSTK